MRSLLRVPILYRALTWCLNAESAYRLLVERTGYRPGQRVLDIGCGPGHLCKYFEPADYVGIDLSEAYIAFARRNLAGTFHVLSADRIGELTDRFDLAVMCGVFHHLSDDIVRATLAGLASVLKPRGRFALVEAVWPSRRWDLPGYVIRKLDRGQYIRTKAEWCRLLGEHWQLAEAQIVRNGAVEYFVCALQPPADVVAAGFSLRGGRIAG